MYLLTFTLLLPSTLPYVTTYILIHLSAAPAPDLSSSAGWDSLLPSAVHIYELLPAALLHYLSSTYSTWQRKVWTQGLHLNNVGHRLSTAINLISMKKEGRTGLESTIHCGWIRKTDKKLMKIVTYIFSPWSDLNWPLLTRDGKLWPNIDKNDMLGYQYLDSVCKSTV